MCGGEIENGFTRCRRRNLEKEDPGKNAIIGTNVVVPNDNYGEIGSIVGSAIGIAIILNNTAESSSAQFQEQLCLCNF